MPSTRSNNTRTATKTADPYQKPTRETRAAAKKIKAVEISAPTTSRKLARGRAPSPPSASEITQASSVASMRRTRSSRMHQPAVSAHPLASPSQHKTTPAEPKKQKALKRKAASSPFGEDCQAADIKAAADVRSSPPPPSASTSSKPAQRSSKRRKRSCDLHLPLAGTASATPPPVPKQEAQPSTPAETKIDVEVKVEQVLEEGTTYQPQLETPIQTPSDSGVARHSPEPVSAPFLASTYQSLEPVRAPSLSPDTPSPSTFAASSKDSSSVSAANSFASSSAPSIICSVSSAGSVGLKRGREEVEEEKNDRDLKKQRLDERDEREKKEKEKREALDAAVKKRKEEREAKEAAATSYAALVEAEEADDIAKSRTHYEVLGVDKKATQQEIKQAYRVKAPLNHPDKFVFQSREQAKAEVEMKRINSAYVVLKDEGKRREYDHNVAGGAHSGGGGGWGPWQSGPVPAPWADRAPGESRFPFGFNPHAPGFGSFFYSRAYSYTPGAQEEDD